ncbi:MAG: hypothetical protein NTX25_15700, partial [Proteobacteria bacterium]|nr:hypothetical protein [Pseudomonadota bacterium]
TGKQRTSADPEPKSLPKLGREQTKPLLIGLDDAGEAKRQYALVYFKASFQTMRFWPQLSI